MDSDSEIQTLLPSPDEVYSKPRALWGEDSSELSLGCPGLRLGYLGEQGQLG